MAYTSKQNSNEQENAKLSAKPSTQLFNDQRDSTNLQLKQQQLMQAAQTPAQFEAKPNNTGLPDNLKSGIENLSGYSMDDVKVHYNSDQPEQLNAHAYAQGTDIHVAPGQEQHLPHEAWHVVQQKQGRVQATTQMKANVQINDDEGLENEADLMGEKAMEQGTTQMHYKQDVEIPEQPSLPDSRSSIQKKNHLNTGAISHNPVAQLGREYDTTLAPHKAKLTEWLLETNRTLGISQEGESSDITSNQKSNFGWHHILAFAELSQHGESKTAPANHGGNLRLGPMKNRLESNDVSGGTSVDYSYLPLDENEDIVLDDYSQKIMDGTIKVSDKSSLTNKLTSSTSAKTPQAENFTLGKESDAFGEWFLETNEKNKFLSANAIASKLEGVESSNINLFVQKIDKQFDSLLRTYKYYNKKKEVQITSGVPMTDISEGNFGHITIMKGSQEIKASTIIDELLRDQKWVKRGSQGALQDETTTYKFGLASYQPFVQLVEAAAKDIDLTTYRDEKLIEFKSELETAFSDFRNSGKENEHFDQDKEDLLITTLVENLKAGAANYNLLWNGVNDVTDQYVTVKIDVSDENWKFPVPEVDLRRNAITNPPNAKSNDSEESDDETPQLTSPEQTTTAWDKTFTDKLVDWDKTTPLFDDNPEDGIFINFDNISKSINSNEQKWKMVTINKERQENRKDALPKDFLTRNMTVSNVEEAIKNVLSEAPENYLSNVKEDLTLDQVKDELKNSVGAYFNVFSKRLKGVAKDLDIRRQAFGAHFEGFINTTKWNVINSTTIPNDVEGTEGKKWADLGGLQKTLYDAWLEQAEVEDVITKAATSKKLGDTLP